MNITQTSCSRVHSFHPSETLGECRNPHKMCTHTRTHTHITHQPPQFTMCVTSHSDPQLSSIQTTLLPNLQPLFSCSPSQTHFHRPTSSHMYCCRYVFLNHLTCAKLCCLLFLTVSLTKFLSFVP